MATNAKGFLKVADALALDQDEDHHRSAVSRYFYAGFHTLGHWQSSLPGYVTGAEGYAGGTHQQLINKLRSPDSLCTPTQKTQSRFFATKLESLRVRRVVADYKIEEQLEAGELIAQQSQTRKILKDCA